MTVHNENLHFITIDDIGEEFRRVRTDEAAVLEKVNSRIAAGESIQDIINFLFNNSRDICACDRIGISFLEDSNTRLEAYYAVADYEPFLLGKGFWQDLAGSSLQELLRKNTIRIIDDLEQYLEDHPSSVSTSLLLREGVCSSMTCPLVVDERPVGFLFRSSRKKKAFDYRNAYLHLMLAERLSQAVEKAYLIEQLKASNRSYTEMLGFVSHELKNPLASIILDSKLLTDGYLGDVKPEQELKLKKIISKSEYLMSLIKDYLDLARIEAGTLSADIKDNVDIRGDVIETSISVLEAQINNKKMTLTLDFPDEKFPVRCDPELMKVVFTNLIGNAVKYGNEGGTVRVKIRKENNVLHASVWNSGPGFPEEEKMKLFKKFSRLDSPELKKKTGTGVGLYSVKQIISLHNGRISANSKNGEWAEFFFEIPQLD